MGYRDESAKEGFHEPRQSCQQQWVKLGSWLGISMVKAALFSSQLMRWKKVSQMGMCRRYWEVGNTDLSMYSRFVLAPHSAYRALR
jgi:hypothetical protein